MKTLSPNKMSEMDYKKISQAFIYPLKILIGFLLMFAFTVSMTSGQTLEDYLLIAAEKNPELQSQFRQYSASVERIAQAGALPDPEISMGFFIQRMETLMGNQKMDVSLMQMFPWFGMLKVQEEEAALMANANYEIFRDAKNNLFFQVKESYYQLYLLEEKRKIATENKKILETMERLALVRFQGGNTSDVINIPAPSPSTPQKDTQANAMGMGAAMSQSSSSSMVQSSMGMPGMGGGGSSG